MKVYNLNQCLLRSIQHPIHIRPVSDRRGKIFLTILVRTNYDNFNELTDCGLQHSVDRNIRACYPRDDYEFFTHCHSLFALLSAEL